MASFQVQRRLSLASLQAPSQAEGRDGLSSRAHPLADIRLTCAQSTAQIQDQQKVHQEEVELLHGRVAGILGRKDEQISKLTRQITQLQQKLLGFDELFAKEKQSLLHACDE